MEEPEVAPEPVVGTEPAQPEEGPSQEAPPAAAESVPTEAPSATDELLAREKARRERQQSVLDRRASAAEEAAQEAIDRAATLEAELNASKMASMTEAQRVEFRQELADRAVADERAAIGRDRAQIEETQSWWYWFDHFAKQGVPVDKLKECEDFPAMSTASINHFKNAPAVPQAPGEETPPAVQPSDQVQGGGTGAPPSREWDKLKASGHGPGTKEFRDLAKRQRRSGRKDLL